MGNGTARRWSRRSSPWLVAAVVVRTTYGSYLAGRRYEGAKYRNCSVTAPGNLGLYTTYSVDNRVTQDMSKSQCPRCRGLNSRVLETRGLRRRRECLACKHRWTTYEFS